MAGEGLIQLERLEDTEGPSYLLQEQRALRGPLELELLAEEHLMPKVALAVGVLILQMCLVVAGLGFPRPEDRCMEVLRGASRLPGLLMEALEVMLQLPRTFQLVRAEPEVMEGLMCRVVRDARERVAAAEAAEAAEPTEPAPVLAEMAATDLSESNVNFNQLKT